MPATDSAPPSRRQLFAIALVSFAILFFQIAITRVLSVVQWYHWAFLSVSLVMLGLGVPGAWFALRPPREGLLVRVLLLGGPALPAAIAGVLWIGNRFGSWSIVACMLCLLVPAMLLGTAVCVLLLQARGSAVGRMYAADLVGASLAAAMVLPVLSLLPTPHALALSGLLPLVAAVACGARPWVSALLGVVIVALTVHGGALRVRQTKSYDESELPLLYERWTPTARLSFADLKQIFGIDRPGFGWGFGTKAPAVTVPQIWMEQDASAGTPITSFDGDTKDLSEFDYLLYDVTSVGYQLRDSKRVAVIGGGGGRDILTALRSGATDVDAVELNGGVVDAVSRVFRDFSGDVYHAPGVHAHVSEGRSFLTRSRGDYDLIQISLIDSWAATAAGAFTLAENNLYTVEAMRLYLERLRPGGVLSTSRWRADSWGLESMRLLFLYEAALRGAGIAQPERHLLAVSGGSVMTLLASKTPWSDGELQRLREVAELRGFEVHFPANDKLGEPTSVPALLRDGPGVLEARGFVMTPPTDDKPFFFQTQPVFARIDLEQAKRSGINTEGVAALQILMLVLSALTLLLFFAPFVLGRWMARRPDFWRGSSYFAAIGLSFLLIEIPWLQRFVLYLGHPSVAATVVIGALLLGAGLGASRSERTGLANGQRLWPLAPVLLAAINLLLSPLFAATLGASEAVRIALAVVVLLPVGFVLGHFFPLGMVRFGDDDKPWFWALNGACSVLAGVISLALAMVIGFQGVAWIGVGGYVLAGLLLRGGRAR
jgi:hypothetical protein